MSDIVLPEHDGEAAGAALAPMAAGRTLVGLGEPLHGLDEFPRLRNGVFRHLARHAGFRTLALESDAWAGRVADAWVQGGPGDVDDVLARGLSHGFGRYPANRELLEWARRYNDGRPPPERVHVTGFDTPAEMTSVPSPRGVLTHLHGYLAAHVDPPCDRDTLDRLLGPDEPWADEAAAWDPARSVGAEDRVRDLRVHADDLARTLAAAAPALLRATGRDALDDARLAARCAGVLLAQHATMATPGDPGRRWSRLGALRGAAMAANLTALAARGPVLAFAHNAHLRTGPASMTMGPMRVHWEPVGAHLADRFGRGYLPVATALGRAEDPDIGDPGPDTAEGALCAGPPGNRLLAADALPPASVPRATAHPGYAPVDPLLAAEVDAVLFVRTAGCSIST